MGKSGAITWTCTLSQKKRRNTLALRESPATMVFMTARTERAADGESAMSEMQIRIDYGTRIVWGEPVEESEHEARLEVYDGALRRLLTEALQLSNDTVSHIPLHNQIIPWAMKKNIEVVHRADNRLDWRLIKVN